MTIGLPMSEEEVNLGRREFLQVLDLNEVYTHYTHVAQNAFKQLGQMAGVRDDESPFVEDDRNDSRLGLSQVSNAHRSSLWEGSVDV